MEAIRNDDKKIIVILDFFLGVTPVSLSPCAIGAALGILVSGAPASTVAPQLVQNLSPFSNCVPHFVQKIIPHISSFNGVFAMFAPSYQS